MTKRKIVLYIFHIGKCVRSSLQENLKKKNIKFYSIHGDKPSIHMNYNYDIMLRGPIKRFISAFKWKKFKLLTEEGQMYNGMKKI